MKKEPNKYVLRNAVILDGTEAMEPKKGYSVFVEDENIVRIAADAELDAEALEGWETVDLAGKFLMPGLINLHVHLPAGGKPKKKERDNAKTVRLVTATAAGRAILKEVCASFAKTELLSGVTTLRTVGGVMNVDSTLRDEIAAGKRVGPRIIASNMAVSVPGGHMAGSLAYEATSAAEAREYVRVIATGGPDLIKLMITGGVLDAKKKGEPGELKMPAEYVAAACKEAHRLGLKVAAHVESTEGVRVALRGGVDSIEHGAEPDAEILRLFKENGAFQVSTISPALPYALFDREISGASEMSQYNGMVVFKGIIDLAKALLAEGVPVGLGTDTGCPYITHYDMWRELYYFKKYCGVTPAFSLYSATLQNARLLGLDSVIGSVEEGKIADLIVCDGNPLEDLSVLRKLSMVIARGKRIADPAPKKMPQVERELDKFLD